MRDTQDATFGALLRRYRQAAGLTQEALAQSAGLSANGVSQLERGERRHPYPHTVQALAEALGLAEADRASLLSAVQGRGRPSPAAAGHGLPTPPTPLVGREQELGEVATALETSRLLTLTGPGGVGKTRLGVEAARAAGDAGGFPDGVAFVPLAALSDAQLVVPTICRSLGITERAAGPLHDALRAHLRPRRLLLILDNFEHLLPAAPEVAALIESCPKLTVLATSRAPLRVRGEHEYPVRPLAYPRSTVPPTAEDVAGSPAGRLFVERARAVRPTFALDAIGAAAVAAICGRLAGLPLALELAATRVKVLSPGQLLVRLDEALLTSGLRDLPPRQLTMRATLDWSYELLAPAEQALFRRLGVFAGGFALEAAEAVGAPTGVAGAAGAAEAGNLVELLGEIVEQSLVVAEPGADDGEVRYRRLEPVRQYGIELLARRGAEAEETRRRHARYYQALAGRAATGLRGPRQGAWSRRLETDHDNLRAALSWALEREDYRLALDLAGSLGEFWFTRGYLREGGRWLGAALAKGAGTQHAPARIRALISAAAIAWAQGDFERALGLGEESLMLAREVGEPLTLATAAYTVGRAAFFANRLERASTLIEEAIAAQRTSGDSVGLVRSLSILGWLAAARGEYERAMAVREDALVLSQQAADDYTTIYLWALGAVSALGLRDPLRARELVQEGIRLSWQRDMKRHLAVSFQVSAALESQRGHPTRSARLLGAMEALYESMSTVSSPVEHRIFGPYFAMARAQLADATWEAARTEGRRMTAEQAVAYALDEG